MKKIMMTVFVFLMVIVFSGIASANELDYIENIFQQDSVYKGAVENWNAAIAKDRLSGDSMDYVIMNESIDEAKGLMKSDVVYIIITYKKGMYFASDVGFEPISLFDDNSSIRVKFDDGEIIQYKGKTNVDFMYTGIDFLEKMKNSKTMVLEFKPMFGDSREVVNFNLDGFDEAFKWLLE